MSVASEKIRSPEALRVGGRVRRDPPVVTFLSLVGYDMHVSNEQKTVVIGDVSSALLCPVANVVLLLGPPSVSILSLHQFNLSKTI